MAITIAQAIKKILIREPFYGLFLIGLNKYFDNSIPTACVRKNGINVDLVINKEYGDSLNEETCINVLLHELSHILFKHLGLGNDFPDREKFNIAADLHVNSYLNNVPNDGYHPKDFGFDIGNGTKGYYENLPDNINFNQSNHSWDGFKDISSSEKQLIENQIDYRVKTVAEEILKTRGNIPGYLKEYIDNLFKKKESVFNGKSYFRRVVGNSIKSYLKSTKYRPSRRFKGQPGITLKFKPKILVAIDTSGSVSDKELQEFFSEIEHLYKTGIYIEIVEFDTRIQHKFVYKGEKTDIKIVGRGGTSADEVYTYYTEHSDFSSLVIFTDGYLDIDYPKRKNMIGVISSNGQRQNYPGISVYIPKEI